MSVRKIDCMLGLEFGEKLLTMDVRLKKEYHHALMGNVEVGYGTETGILADCSACGVPTMRGCR